MTYLEKEDTKAWLTKASNCLSNLDCLDDWIEIAESVMDEWLRQHYGIREYQETYRANHNGIITLNRASVVDVIQVCAFDRVIYHKDKSYPITQGDPHVVWDGKFNIMTGSCECDRTVYEVTYTAGKEEIPLMFKIVARNILKVLVENNGDISSLYESPREIEEVQNPSVGGTFKQKFKRNSFKAGTTKLDLMMKPLAKYRKSIRTR